MTARTSLTITATAPTLDQARANAVAAIPPGFGMVRAETSRDENSDTRTVTLHAVPDDLGGLDVI